MTTHKEFIAHILSFYRAQQFWHKVIKFTFIKKIEKFCRNGCCSVIISFSVALIYATFSLIHDVKYHTKWHGKILKNKKRVVHSIGSTFDNQIL